MGKKCSKCHKYKNSKGFYKHLTNRDGLNDKCKECLCKYQRLWQQKNKAHSREWARIYRKTEKAKTIKKNSTHKYRKTKTGRAMTRKAFQKYQRTAKGKEANLRATCKRRSIFKKAKEAFTLTLDEWLETLEYFKNRCAYCGRKSKKLLHEHVVPLERGGWHTKVNVVPACISCNLLKGKKMPFSEWDPPSHLKKLLKMEICS